jgi:acyl-CoA synthetase (AMP-forming)/AMP-acid ligase II
MLVSQQTPGVVQVESVLSQHPGVARAVVVGVPDSRLGERVVACVSVKDGWNWVDARAEHEHRGGGKEVSPQILHGYCRTKELSRCSPLSSCTVQMYSSDEKHVSACGERASV